IVREDGKAPTQFMSGYRTGIGRGQCSVYRALELNTRTIVAVKRIRLEGLKEDEISQLMREVDLIRYLSHPSIVQYEGMSRDDTWLNIVLENVLEYVENVSLGQTLKAFGKLNERLVANYVVKILEGLHFLHQNDVVHCDLRAANILTTKNGNVKLSDFGNSLNVRAMEREMKHVAAMPNWMAPEVIELKGVLTKSDIWSLACTVIELLTGRPPYADISNIISVMFRIVEDERPPLPECSESLQSFLKWCFNRDPIKRPNAEQLLEHDWLKKYAGADLEMRDSNRSSTDEHSNPLDLASSPPRRRLSNDTEPISPREHSFVKVTFSKCT
ncbi:kinase-like protein, partial [Trametes versicolor FP-101664 SS1]|uniref:kinase-like protein n=1 Tax=Trametes versicolor (strain FP-101664) TaxID=717944 RepID=UPI000462202D